MVSSCAMWLPGVCGIVWQHALCVQSVHVHMYDMAWLACPEVVWLDIYMYIYMYKVYGMGGV